jgi:hypothetical protein
LIRLQVLIFSIKALNVSGPAAVYDAVEKPLQLAQTAAILEVTTIETIGHDIVFSVWLLFILSFCYVVRQAISWNSINFNY